MPLLTNQLTKSIEISVNSTTQVQNLAVFQTLRDDQTTAIIPQGRFLVYILQGFPDLFADQPAAVTGIGLLVS